METKSQLKRHQTPPDKGIYSHVTHNIPKIFTFLQWRLRTLMKYTFIPVSFNEFIVHKNKGWPIVHEYPYLNLPLLECHILPPYAVINVRQKLCRNQINEINSLLGCNTMSIKNYRISGLTPKYWRMALLYSDDRWYWELVQYLYRSSLLIHILLTFLMFAIPVSHNPNPQSTNPLNPKNIRFIIIHSGIVSHTQIIDHSFYY